jgi:hypothetical protein
LGLGVASSDTILSSLAVSGYVNETLFNPNFDHFGAPLTWHSMKRIAAVVFAAAKS